MQSSFLILFSSALLTRVDPVKLSLAFLDRFLNKCCFPAWKRLIFPEPVTLNLFFALECVFILGIILSLGVQKYNKKILEVKLKRLFFRLF